MVELLPVPQQDERLGAPRQSPSFGSVEGQLTSVEILQVRGLPVSIRRDPASLFLDASGWAEAFSGSGVSSVLTEG
jgi:hypothetical protein